MRGEAGATARPYGETEALAEALTALRRREAEHVRAEALAEALEQAAILLDESADLLADLGREQPAKNAAQVAMDARAALAAWESGK